jgi:hypothetical protein
VTKEELLGEISVEHEYAWPLIVEFVAAWLDSHYVQDGVDVDWLTQRWREEMT